MFSVCCLLSQVVADAFVVSVVLVNALHINRFPFGECFDFVG